MSQHSSTKNQKSILEFTKVQTGSDENESNINEHTVEVKTETIDLTIDEPIASYSSASEDVLCPVCSKDIVDLNFEDRIKHVEECLSLSLIKEEDSALNQRPVELKESKIMNGELKSLSTLKNESIDKKTKEETNNKKRKSSKLASPKQEKQRYINKESNLKKPKIFDISDELLQDNKNKQELQVKILKASEIKAQLQHKSEGTTPQIKVEPIKPPKYRRQPIPELKTLTFPKNSFKFYQISVDAFNFKPHETIDKYFLSHFHADHYGGISKKWCSEGSEICQRVIYCSKITGRLLQIRFNIEPVYIRSMDMDERYLIQSYLRDSSIDDYHLSESDSPGLYVKSMTANHCPGAVIFLFESIDFDGNKTFMLHCGDFRINRAMIEHPALQPFHNGKDNALMLQKVYLDTTYMSRNYNFPKQELVCDMAGEMFYRLIHEEKLFSTWFGSLQSRVTDFFTKSNSIKKKKLLIIVGTYLIGKERVAISILKKLGNCPIFISNIKSRGDKKQILLSYEDEYLNSVITDNDLGTDENESIIHLVPMDIVGSMLDFKCYFNHNSYFNHFERCVGLRPSGWTFSATAVDKFGPTNEKETEENDDDEGVIDEIIDSSDVNHEIKSIMTTLRNQPKFNYVDDILKQSPMPNKVTKGKQDADNSLYKIYGLPYSEHSSYRELSYFVIFLNIGEVIPTVNTHNEWRVAAMNQIINLWITIKRIKYENNQNHQIDSKLLKDIKSLCLDDF